MIHHITLTGRSIALACDGTVTTQHGAGGATGAVYVEASHLTLLHDMRDGGATEVSPVSARDAVAAGVLATRSLRSGSVPFDVPELDAELADYFHRGQHNPHTPTESS